MLIIRVLGVQTLQTRDSSDPRHFGTSAELSVRHIGTSAELSVRHIGTSAELSVRHIGTGAERHRRVTDINIGDSIIHFIQWYFHHKNVLEMCAADTVYYMLPGTLLLCHT